MQTTCRYCETEIIKICKMCGYVIGDPKKDAVIHYGKLIHTTCAIKDTREKIWRKRV